MKHVAYYRVSTARQGQSGLGLESQQALVKAYLGASHELVCELTEIESGKRSDRPKLLEALRLCRAHKATLVIAKLDRLARNVAFVSNLMESGVDFVACDFPQANRLTLHILAAVAEHEAVAISERTKSALTAAKARGIKLGGDRGKLHLARAAVKHKRKISPIIAAITPLVRELHKTQSLRSIASTLVDSGITSPSGKAWTATAIKRILNVSPRALENIHLDSG